MGNNSTIINKTNNHLSPSLTEHKKNHDIRRWKFRSWLGTPQKCDAVKQVNLYIYSARNISVYLYNLSYIFVCINLPYAKTVDQVIYKEALIVKVTILYRYM